MAIGVRRALLGVAAAAALCGCPNHPPGTPEPAPGPYDRAVRLGPAPVLTCKPDPQFRWLDALDQPYSERFRQTFSYENPEVILSYASTGTTFQGFLRARRLKPNFAYQVKLVGMPTALWPDDGHDEANRRLGELGRWWAPGELGGNRTLYSWDDSTDQAAEKKKMEGYLLFDYFVTNANGNADVALRLDRSLHVLWKTSQWPPAEGDSAPTQHPILAEAGTWGYDRSFPPGELEVYAEHERGRPPIGKVKLPPGHYRCFFLLTEESFHAWGGGHGGEWAAAMAAPIEFTITQDTPEGEKQGGSPPPKAEPDPSAP